MHRSKRSALVLTILAMFAAILPVSAQETDSAESADTVYVWAMLEEETSTAADIETTAASLEGVVEATSTIQGFDFETIVRIEAQGTDHEAIATRLSDALGVEVAPGNVELRLMDDPLQGDQYALMPPADGGIEVAPAWARSRGEGAVVAVGDSGIDLTHPDIEGVEIVAPYDFIENDEDPQETVGHGTAVSSVIAAPENGVGIVGAAPDAAIMPLRVCPGDSCDFNAVIEAVAYAGENDADIINLSLGTEDVPEGTPGIQPIYDAITEVVEEHDLLVVAAAGNASESSEEWELVPAEGPDVLGVASSSPDGTFTDEFSSYGDQIEVAAPGHQVLLAHSDSGGWGLFDGTSFSSPYTAAAAALIEGANDRSAADVRSYLNLTVTPESTLEGRVSSGGIVNARYAVWASKFTDVLETVFIKDIAWIAEQRVTLGCNPPDNDLYCTDWEVEREEMASFIARALDLPPATQDYFTDDDGSVHEDDINAIREAGISFGCNAPENTEYCPRDVVTRGQMAAFLDRAFDWQPSSEDAFEDDADSIFQDSINRAAENGVAIGCNPPANDQFCVEDGVIRGEMAAFLRRAITGQNN